MYVPSIRTIQQFEDPEDPSGEPEVTDIEIDHFCQIMIGGDQVTAARVRGSQSIRRNSDNGRMQLDAFNRVVEDWHTKMCFMQVSSITYNILFQVIFQVVWSHLYKQPQLWMSVLFTNLRSSSTEEMLVRMSRRT